MNIQEIFKKNKIDYLTHFTSIYNLESILENGLLSVNYMNKNNIQYSNNDNNRFDNQLNYISVSTSEINKKMLYKKYHNNERNLNIWIILVLDLSLLLDLSMNIYYCYKNAASSEISMLLKNNAEIFKTTSYINKFLNSNDIQKEILIKDSIPVKYIKGIIIKNQNDKDIVSNILNSKKINIPVICKSEMF